MYVVHAFQKKSKKGAATPKRELDLITKRLELAEQDCRKIMNVMTKITEGSGNVFKDLGFPDSGEMLTKAEPTRQIYAIIKARGLGQTAAAKLPGLEQPDVSSLMRGRYSGFSTDRLIHLPTALDRDVDIVIKRKSRSRRQANVRVVAA